MTEEFERALNTRKISGLVINDCDHRFIQKSDNSWSRIATQGGVRGVET
jgi:hypothetical protein